VSLGGFGFDELALVFDDLSSECFCLPFHQLGLDVEPCEFAEKFAALGEADVRGDEAGHAESDGRNRGGIEAECTAAGSKALGATVTVIPVALQSERAE